MTTLPLIPSAPRVSQARISFPIMLTLALVFLLAAWAAIPVKAEVVPPIRVSVSLDKTTVAVGKTVTATWAGSGGRGPYTYSYYWSVRSGGYYFEKYRSSGYADVTTSSFAPDMGELCVVFVYVKDADGRTNSFYKEIPVTGSEVIPPLRVSVSLDKTTVAVGETVRATWAGTGGRGPYTYSYYWKVRSGGQYFEKYRSSGYADVTTSSFIPDMGELCEAYVSVKDADGRTNSMYAEIPVTGSEVIPPLYVSVSMNRNAVALGGTVTATWVGTGGRGPYTYSYYWKVRSGGQYFEKYRSSGYVDVTTSSFIPDMGELCEAYVSVKDADGRTNSYYKEIPICDPAEEIKLNISSVTLDINKQAQLTATITPYSGTLQVATWSSSDPKVAVVNDQGLVTAIGEGEATITATVADGSDLSAECAVTVNPPIPVSSVIIEKPDCSISSQGKYRLKTTILPENATDQALTWNTSNASVATVQDGVVTGKSKGKATITATAKSGIKASCEVTIESTVSRVDAFAYNMGIRISATQGIIVTTGAQYGTPPYDITVTLKQDSTVLGVQNVTTSSSKEVFFYAPSIPGAVYTATAVATDAKGRMDTATTSCYMYASGWNMGVTLITVDRPFTAVTAISFENPSPLVKIGQTLYLSPPTVSPASAPNPSYEWTSGNPTVATVANGGIVQGVKKGTSVITASATDGSGLSASCTVTVYRAVDSVSLNRSEIKLTQGEKATLTATVLPADADYRSVTWESSDPSVATVSGGVVTGVRDGTVTVTATTQTGLRATCDVTVSNKIESIALPLLEELPLVNGAYELNLKETLQLAPQTVPLNVGASFAYTPSNSKVLSVSKLGVVQGLKVGNCILTITARNASTTAALTKTVSFRVIVPAASVRMDPGFTIFAKTSRKLKASVSPSSATYRQLKWSSSNKSVATVDPATGNVYGVSPGTADITATAHNGMYFTRQIRVTLPVGSITLTAPDKAIYVGKTTLIKADVQPEDADDSLKWTSSSTKIATVSQDGLVTGKGPGTVKITVAATDGSKKSVSLVLKVVKPASFISLKEALTLYTNGKATEKLAITTSPAKSGYLSVTWLSDEPSIASVDQYGVVTAHADGTAVISATTDPALGKSAVCTVTVLTYPSYIKLNLLATLKVGDKLQLIPPLVVELNGSVKSLTWKSSKPNLATIDKQGVLTAKKPGLVEIRVTTANGLYAKAKLTITK